MGGAQTKREAPRGDLQVTLGIFHELLEDCSVLGVVIFGEGEALPEAHLAQGHRAYQRRLRGREGKRAQNDICI